MLDDLRRLNEVQARHPILRGAAAQIAQLRRRLESELRPLRRRAVWWSAALGALVLLIAGAVTHDEIQQALGGWSRLARMAAILPVLLLFQVCLFASIGVLEIYQRRAAQRLAALLAPLLGRLETGESSAFMQRFALAELLPAEGRTQLDFRLTLAPTARSAEIASLVHYGQEGVGQSWLWLLAVGLPDARPAAPLHLRSRPTRWLPDDDPEEHPTATGDADFDRRFHCRSDSAAAVHLPPALRRALLALLAAGGPLAVQLHDSSLLLAWKRRRRNFRELPMAGALVGERTLARLLHDWALLLDVAAAGAASGATTAPPAAR